MAIPTFFHSNLKISDNEFQLSPEEFLHAVRSRRLKVGDQINVINGFGLSSRCVLSKLEGRQISASVVSSTQTEKPLTSLSIAVALPKGDRQRTMVDMLTQLGVGEMFPLQCEHSIAQFRSNTHKKWQRTAIQACKQSQNPWLPLIHDVHTVAQILHHLCEHNDIDSYYADAGGESLNPLAAQNTKLMVCIGPEGGFSSFEIDSFMQSGMQALRLSTSILRTETAAVSFAAQAQSLNKN